MNSPRLPWPVGNWFTVWGSGSTKTRPSPNAALWPPPPGWAFPFFWIPWPTIPWGMNLVRTDREGYPIQLSAQRDVFDSAAIPFSSGHTGFVELGGGGPKNFIQQTGPTISQILGVDFEGADRGLQITTAAEREGSLSGCTFGEAVTWGKYRAADEDKLVQIWGEYSIIFPLLVAYVLDQCAPKTGQKHCLQNAGIPCAPGGGPLIFHLTHRNYVISNMALDKVDGLIHHAPPRCKGSPALRAGTCLVCQSTERCPSRPKELAC